MEEAKKKAKGRKEEANREMRGSTCLWPARCSKTRWRDDGEAMATERPSCSLGYHPIKAGTLLLTQDCKVAATTGSERATTQKARHYWG